MIRKVVLVALLGLGLAGCTTTGGDKQTGGALTGAALGGLLGSQFGGGKGQLAATAAGVVIGGLIGSEIGASLDRADRLALQRNTQAAYTGELGEPIVWNNPDNGNRVIVTPTRDGRSQSGSYCREFQQTIIVGGRQEQAYGTACQQPDGSWKIVG